MLNKKSMILHLNWTATTWSLSSNSITLILFHCTEERDLQTYPILHGKINGCGVRVLNVSPSLDANDARSSETDQSGESDEETKRCKKKMRVSFGIINPTENYNCYLLINMKMKIVTIIIVSHPDLIMMQMIDETSEGNNISLCGQTAVNSGSMAPNLELSLGLVGASAQVASRS